MKLDLYFATQEAMRLSRRSLFGRGAAGIGTAALSSLLGQAQAKGILSAPHLPIKAKRVIYLMQNGAPSHLDLFDHKPHLSSKYGQNIPDTVRGTTRLSTITSSYKNFPVLPALRPFAQESKVGRWFSTLIPHTSAISAEICLIKSMHTQAVNHAPAVTLFLTGHQIPGRPSMGAWASYGLGSENSDLPAFVVMTSRDREASCGQLLYDYYWGSGFIPSKHQGVRFRSDADPVIYLSNPPGISSQSRRNMLDKLAQMNRLRYETQLDPEIDTRIAQYEMAFRMQSSVPELADISNEPAHILEMYGADVKRPGSFARNCLLARRLAERGVKFIQLMHAGWDQHNNLPTQLEVQCKDTDQPSAALVRDLKQRGLLEDTLVIWGGEFGRTPFGQGDIKNRLKHGRDHHGACFSIWMAGGGVKPGLDYGSTDDYAFNVAHDPVHVHDFQATVMHLMGIDHERLTYRYQGRQFRLTDVHGHVVKPLLA
jgi:hypothetical protein